MGGTPNGPTSIVYIETPGNVTIGNSSFIGVPGRQLNGVEIRDATSVSVSFSEFSLHYFGLYTEWNSLGPQDINTEGQIVSITDSYFSNNSYGYLASNLGTLPRLSIIDNVFESNVNGAGSLCCLNDFEQFTFLRNSGSDNQGHCPAFIIASLCLALDEEVIVGA